jgi:pimeloyl-ACP methyl ester carboxylesterase
MSRPAIVLITFALLFIIPTVAVSIGNNFFGPNKFAFGQPNQMNFNITNSLNIEGMQAKKVHVDDMDIAYKTFGKGNPLLLISGSGLVMDAWEASILKELSSNHTVIIFDNRGVGNTTIGTKPFSIQQFANDTAGLLDALKIQKADVLGYSMGSFVAQDITVLHPEKVNKLILYGARCGGKEGMPQNPEVIKVISDFVHSRQVDLGKLNSLSFPPEWIKSHPNYLENIPKSKEIVTPNIFKQQLNIVEDWQINSSGVCSQLPKIFQPTLVITGTEDVLVPAANSLIIAEKIPGAWLVQIKGGGHGLMYQYPEQFSKIVKTFLENT